VLSIQKERGTVNFQKSSSTRNNPLLSFHLPKYSSFKMMMNRHRSSSRNQRRESESRQPEEDGRRSGSSRLIALTNNPPRTPRSTAASTTTVPTTPLPASGVPASPHSAPPTAPSSTYPKARCYRLNLEKPFDIRQQKSPLGRDYSGPPIHDSDLPPAQGPVEYFAPPHLASREEMKWRRHSWGGHASAHHHGASSPSELMANLHVSVSEESASEGADSTMIAISTARIFRGIVVDRNGLITSMNSRAMRSQRSKNGGENKNKMGEKSRQAVKIDKAKDLIDDCDGAGGRAEGNEENEPTKIVSLFVMGEYEDLNDLVRDGSKKLRDSKTLSDDAIFLYNRPRQFPPGMHPLQMQNHQQQQLQQQSQQQQQNHPMAISTETSNIMVPAPYSPANSSQPTQYTAKNGISNNTRQKDPDNASGASPTSTHGASNASSPSNLRKRVFSSDRSRSRFKQVPRSTPPKLKSNPRESTRSGTNSRSASRPSSGGALGASNGGASSPTNSGGGHGYHRGSSNVSHHTTQQQQQHGVGMLNCNPINPVTTTTQQKNGSSNSSSHNVHQYFPQQCNFFPGNSDWTEALGFSVNSLWNCGANGGHMSPTMSPQYSTSPRSSAVPAPATGGGVYHGSGAPAGTVPGGGGYHGHGGNSYHPPGAQGVNVGGYNGGGYNHYSTNGGNPYRGDEGRNPSPGGYSGYARTGTGVRDTVVM